MRNTLLKSAYFGLCALIYLLALPLLLILCFKAKYLRAIPARFFLRNNPRIVACDVWIHACSFGEVRSLLPLVERLRGRILITVITETGYREAKKLYPTHQVAYLPFEIFLPYWAPRTTKLIVTEAELWAGLFAGVKRQGGKTLLINARMSDRSYPKYRQLTLFYRWLFGFVDRVFVQREEDKKRFEALGARRVSVMGNLKLLNLPKPSKSIPKPEEQLIVGASTHEGEEEIILGAFLSQRGSKLALVPRHPERFARVWEMLRLFSQASGLRVARCSDSPAWWEADIMLVDQMGELINLYAIADVVILGGSFVPVGGHNPLEPAFFGCRLLSGKYIDNQQALFENITGYRLIESSELKDLLTQAKSLPKSAIKSGKDPREFLDEILNA